MKNIDAVAELTFPPADAAILRAIGRDCEAAGEAFPSWTAEEFVRKKGGLAHYTMAKLGLEEWIAARGYLAATAFYLAAAIVEQGDAW
jgi:hypothetical protein